MYSSEGTWIPLFLNELCLWFHSEQGGVEGADGYRKSLLVSDKLYVLFYSLETISVYVAETHLVTMTVATQVQPVFLASKDAF